MTPVQGSPSVSAERRARVVDAVGRALESHGYTVDVSHALLGQAVVACQSPECIEQTLDAAVDWRDDWLVLDDAGGREDEKTN